MIKWLKRKLGIEFLEERIARLEELEHFTLANIADRLSESYIILTNEDQKAIGNFIVVPPNKSGILVLGKHVLVQNCRIEPAKSRTVTETFVET